MGREVGPNEILIEDIEPGLLQAIGERAKVSGRSVEAEALVLLQRGWELTQTEEAR